MSKRAISDLLCSFFHQLIKTNKQNMQKNSCSCTKSFPQYYIEFRIQIHTIWDREKSAIRVLFIHLLIRIDCFVDEILFCCWHPPYKEAPCIKLAIKWQVLFSFPFRFFFHPLFLFIHSYTAHIEKRQMNCLSVHQHIKYHSSLFD